MQFMNVLDYNFFKKLSSLPFVNEIWLFGSRARGDNQERADIDLAILCPYASEQDWHQILDIIENADTLLKIDCIRFDSLGENDKLRHNILAHKQILYKKQA